jgi:hypothetical protein
VKGSEGGAVGGRFVGRLGRGSCPFNVELDYRIELPVHTVNTGKAGIGHLC